MSNITNGLLKQCEIIRNQLECQIDGGDYEIIANALDLEFSINARGEYLGANILCAFGGPNIWIDTRYDRIDGYWGGEHVTVSYQDANDLHSYCEELMPL